jgi:hypothetical protein
MAWTSPMTAVANAALTAAQWNTHVRDNLNETSPAKATAASRWFPGIGANDIRERAILGDSIVTSESTTSTSYTNLTSWGPTVTMTTSTYALVWINAHLATNTAGAVAFASYEVTGASSTSASDVWSCRMQASGTNDDQRAGIAHYQNAITAGSNSFRMMYRTNTGTASFASRHILVMGM